MVFKKIIFQNSLMANETPSRPTPPLMANAIKNFHFDYRHTSLMSTTKCGIASTVLEILGWCVNIWKDDKPLVVILTLSTAMIMIQKKFLFQVNLAIADLGMATLNCIPRSSFRQLKTWSLSMIPLIGGERNRNQEIRFRFRQCRYQNIWQEKKRRICNSLN